MQLKPTANRELHQQWGGGSLKQFRVSSKFLVVCRRRSFRELAGLPMFLRSSLLSLIYSIGLLACTASAFEELRFVQPQELASKFPDGVTNRPALFGVLSNGISLTGKLVYADIGNASEACAELSKDIFGIKGTEVQDVFIVLLDRGDCTFVSKVKRAQDIGAKAVVIVNNEEHMNDPELPYMADDGNGGSIHIPSVIISFQDGNTIKEFLKQKKILIASLKWGVPHPEKFVDWSLWTSSLDDSSVELKRNFRDVIESFGDTSKFEPHYIMIDGDVYGCTGSGGTACGNQCTNQGRYCSADPEHDLSTGISGADIVRENLRQICIHKQVANENKIIKWWNYVNCFNENCNGTKFTELCSSACQSTSGINTGEISSCIRNSGGYDDNGKENTHLKNEISLQKEKGVYNLPTIIINNSHYRGALTCPSPIASTNCGVFSAVCSGFSFESQPSVCSTNEGCPVGQTRDACGNCFLPDHPDRKSDPSKCISQNSGSYSSKAYTFFLVLIMVTLLGLVMNYIHRRSQVTMRKELADIMQQYVPLGADESGNLPQNVSSAMDNTDSF